MLLLSSSSSSHHIMPTTSTSFPGLSSTFVVALILSFQGYPVNINSVTPHIHRSIRATTSNLDVFPLDSPFKSIDASCCSLHPSSILALPLPFSIPPASFLPPPSGTARHYVVRKQAYAEEAVLLFPAPAPC